MMQFSLNYQVESYTYEFEPTTKWDEERQQYYPGCKVTMNGNFVEWIEIELGFDQPKYAMPYARELVREMIGRYQWVMEQFKRGTR